MKNLIFATLVFVSHDIAANIHGNVTRYADIDWVEYRNSNGLSVTRRYDTICCFHISPIYSISSFQPSLNAKQTFKELEALYKAQQRIADKLAKIKK